MSKRFLCLGYGYTARAFARSLAAEGWRVAGTARSDAAARIIADDGAEIVPWKDSFDAAALENAGAVLVSVPPNGEGCPALAAARAAIPARGLSWIGYLSSNGVYGDHQGQWIDENTALHPSTDRARTRVAAEAAWKSFAATRGLPLVIFRLPGIYGPGRSAIEAAREGRARRIYKEGQVFSRIHVDDIAAALAASLRRPDAGALFNLADDLPAPPQDVIAFACALLGVAPPPLIPLKEAALSDMARSFYADNKRVRNDRMKEALGVVLQYPTYREGLRAILDAAPEKPGSKTG